MGKTVVFVQGGRANEASYPWRFFHFAPTTEPSPESVDLAFFDYPAGQLKTWKNILLKRGEAPGKRPTPPRTSPLRSR